MTKRAITYARVSSNDKLRTGGENLADQTRLCREYALRQGYEVITELAEDDRGASGATFDLPELSKALEMAREGLFDVFVVRELDRLARDIAKQYIVEQEFKVAGVTIEYALYDFPETPEGQLQKCIYAAFAEFERAKIKERMSRGRRRKVQAGNVIMHGKQLYGYRIIEDSGKKQLEIDENEAEIVRLIFSEYTQGKGLKAIAAQLTQMGVMTRRDIEAQQNGAPTPETLKRRGRGEWCIATVYDMICNETYAGVWRYGKEQIVVNVPAIIDRGLWKAAQEQRGINKETSPRNTKHDYLLRCRLTCGSCGKSMRAVRCQATIRN
jgi:site-specific DNA recombinase